MTTAHQNQEDGRLHSLLRESRPAPGLPPRFQQQVWQRIEQTGAKNEPTNWIDVLAALVLKPRFAFATVAIVLLLGGLIGTWNGTEQARNVAQERYVTAVVMPIAP